MAHGSVQIEAKAASDDLPIAFQDIADSGMEYIALGHWHGGKIFFRECQSLVCRLAGNHLSGRQRRTRAGIRAESGNRQNETFVSPMKITEKEIKEINFDLQMFDNKEALYQEIEKLVNPNLILSVCPVSRMLKICFHFKNRRRFSK